MKGIVELPDDWTILPTSGAEARFLHSKHYFTGRPCLRGHIAPRRAGKGDCLACSNEATKRCLAARYEAERPAREERKRTWEAERPARQEARRERARAAARRDYLLRLVEEGTEEVRREGREKSQAIYRRDPEAQRARRRERGRRGQAGYRALRLRTPPWLSDDEVRELERFYAERPTGLEVDHIVPIVGLHVAGLHVRENLQYLTRAKNVQKSKRWTCSRTEAEAYVRDGRAVWLEDVGDDGTIDWSKYWPDGVPRGP